MRANPPPCALAVALCLLAAAGSGTEPDCYDDEAVGPICKDYIYRVTEKDEPQFAKTVVNRGYSSLFVNWDVEFGLADGYIGERSWDIIAAQDTPENRGLAYKYFDVNALGTYWMEWSIPTEQGMGGYQDLGCGCPPWEPEYNFVRYSRTHLQTGFLEVTTRVEWADYYYMPDVELGDYILDSPGCRIVWDGQVIEMKRPTHENIGCYRTLDEPTQWCVCNGTFNDMFILDRDIHYFRVCGGEDHDLIGQVWYTSPDVSRPIHCWENCQ